MELESLIEKINRLEYHQSILLKMVSNNHDPFFRLIVEKQLTKEEVDRFYLLCEELSESLQEQQAEGFVYFQSLFEKLKEDLPQNLQVEEVIEACLRQQLFYPLMLELKKFI